MTKPPADRWSLIRADPGQERPDALLNRFVRHTAEMRLSWAWAGLPGNARLVLDRLEMEHMRHGGRQNGHLVGTYDDFVLWGVRRGSVRLAIAQAEALGFLQVVRRGGAVSGGKYVYSTYRLTYIIGAGQSPAPTNEWRLLLTEQATRVALRAALSEVETERESKKQRLEARRGQKAVSPGRDANV